MDATNNNNSITTNQGQLNNNGITRDDFQLLAALLSKLTGTQSPMSSTMATNNQTHSPVNNLRDSEGKITNLYHKLHRFENHVKNFKLLTEANKTCASLHCHRFPQPFLRDDSEYVDKWNLLVTDFQSKAMALNTSHSESTHDDAKRSLMDLKETLTMSNNPDLVTSTFGKLEANSKSYIDNTVKESNSKVAFILRSKGPVEYVYKPPAQSSTTYERQPTNQPRSNNNRSNNQRPNYQQATQRNQQARGSYQSNNSSNNSKFRNNRSQSNRHPQRQALHNEDFAY